jgi:hypothetical protein
MRKWIISVVVLASLSCAASVLILMWPFKGDVLSNRASVSAAISGAFSLIAGIIAIIVSARVSSGDYQAEQALKVDTAQLLACLRSIDVKGAWLTQQPQGATWHLDFKREREIINDFLSSTSAFAYWSWVGERGSAAGSTPENWRIFFLSLVEMLGSEDIDYRKMISYALALEELLTNMEGRDVRRIGGYVSDLAEAIGKFKESRQKDTLMSGIQSVFSQRRDRETVARMLQHLKQKGVKDPNLELFLAVTTPGGNVEQAKAALDAGADPSMTDGQLLAKYKSELADFAEDE